VKVGFPRALRIALTAPTPTVSWGVLSIIFSVSGPFGTEYIPGPTWRILFWVAVVGICILLGVIIRVAIQQLRPNTALLSASILASVVTGLILAFLLPGFWHSALGPGALRPPEPLQVAVMVSMLGFGMATLRHLIAPPAALAGNPPEAGQEPAQSKLLLRLPEAIAGDILHLCGSNHYVEVHTSRGSGRVLMRFSDALDEVAMLDGLRVHRSHWVALVAILGTEVVRGRTELVLVTGNNAPVSRAYQDDVENLALSAMPRRRRAASGQG
jgi:hypothetical protein